MRRSPTSGAPARRARSAIVKALAAALGFGPAALRKDWGINMFASVAKFRLTRPLTTVDFETNERVLVPLLKSQPGYQGYFELRVRGARIHLDNFVGKPVGR